MESLKEFNYYDVNGVKIKNPDRTLQYDKKLNKLSWYDAKNSPIGKAPNWRVEATNTTELDQLSKALGRKDIVADQIATPEWLAQKQKIGQIDREAGGSTQGNSTSSQKPTVTNPDTSKSKTPPGKTREALIVDNLVNSGALQKEITKAVVNAESIPILAGDLPRISAAISKALKSAEKTGLFDDEFLSGEGEVINTGQAKGATVGTIANTVLNKYLSVSKSIIDENLYTYTLLPEGDSLQETKGSKKRGSSNSRGKGSSNSGNRKPSNAGGNGNNNNSKIENTTATPQITPPGNQVNPSLNNSTNPPVKEPPVTNPPAQKAKSITLDNIRGLKVALKDKITEMLSEVQESFKSTATSVKFHCVGVVKPSQVKVEKSEEIPASQTEGSSQKDTEPVQEVKEPAQKVEEATHSNDCYVFARLIEAKEDKVSTPDGAGTDGKAIKGKPAGKDGKEKGKSEEMKTTKEEEKPSNAKAEAPVFPSTEALKTLIEGLNKAGSPFETDLAVYALHYTLGDVDVSSLSFDIIVESKKTTPKEGFWESFGKALKAHLKKAGVQIARNLVGNRGHMN